MLITIPNEQSDVVDVFEFNNTPEFGYCCQCCGELATHAVNLQLQDAIEYRQHDLISVFLCSDHALIM